MLAINTILQGRYRIIQQLGHGGMGAVYQALDENLSCLVAVKETFAVTDEERRAFEREAKLLANLNHPSLPKVTHYFAEEGGQFLVMQFIEGHDLAELLSLRGTRFPWTDVLEWADQLLDALEELHSYRPPIIHRDIKPANLKLTPRGRIILLDFGLAKGAAGEMSGVMSSTSGQSIYGFTRHYAPLEQIRGARTDERSDLYALAATIWTLLTGEKPPDALARVDEKEAGRPDPLPSVRDLKVEVPQAVAELLQQALALNREQRPASAALMREQLRRARPTSATSAGDAQAAASSEPPETQVAPGVDAFALPTIQAAPPPIASLEGEAQGVSPHASARKRKARRSLKGDLLALLFFTAMLFIGIALFWKWQKPRSPAASQEQGRAEQQPGQQGALMSSQSATPAPPAGMLYVPGGEFTMGRAGGDEYESPTHSVAVKPFFLDINEVTCQQYRDFIRATGRRAPPGWSNNTYPHGMQQKPVTGVTWDDANAYAKWAGKRLPTEEEWEFAARGTDGRLYAWGDEWQEGLANADGARGSLANVGEYGGLSPFGAVDMIGNAWEWTASNLRAYPGGRMPGQKTPGELKVIRGGAYVSRREAATATYRRGYPPRGNYDYSNTGFRCARDVSAGPSHQ